MVIRPPFSSKENFSGLSWRAMSRRPCGGRDEEAPSKSLRAYLVSALPCFGFCSTGFGFEGVGPCCLSVVCGQGGPNISQLSKIKSICFTNFLFFFSRTEQWKNQKNKINFSLTRNQWKTLLDLVFGIKIVESVMKNSWVRIKENHWFQVFEKKIRNQRTAGSGYLGKIPD